MAAATGNQPMLSGVGNGLEPVLSRNSGDALRRAVMAFFDADRPYKTTAKVRAEALRWLEWLDSQRKAELWSEFCGKRRVGIGEAYVMVAKLFGGLSGKTAWDHKPLGRVYCRIANNAELESKLIALVEASKVSKASKSGK